MIPYDRMGPLMRDWVVFMTIQSIEQLGLKHSFDEEGNLLCNGTEDEMIRLKELMYFNLDSLVDEVIALISEPNLVYINEVKIGARSH